MKAKQSKQLGKLLAFASAIVGLVAVIMIFLPQIVAASENSDTAYNGIAIAFGKQISKIGTENNYILTKVDFSFLNLLCYLLVVVGLLLTVLQICGICKSKLVTFISAIAFIAGGVLFFFALNFSSISTITVTSIGKTNPVVKKFADFNSENATAWKLGTGAIVGGTMALLAGVENIGRALLSK